MLVHQIGTHSTNDQNEFTRINKTLNSLMKFIRYSLLALAIELILCVILFPITNEKQLIFNIAVPFDCKTSGIAFWVTSAFLGGGFIFAILSVMLTAIVWYLMFSISFQYKILGNQLRHMGTSFRTGSSRLKVSLAAQQKFFYKDFITAIQTYNKINGYV